MSKHLRDQHSEYTSKLYYNKFILPPQGCKICAAPTKFENIQIGYKNTCSHKCGGIYHRKKLASDVVKHEKFASKVATNQTKIWKDRKVTGEDKLIAETIRITINKQYALMSTEEKKEKCGWLNKLSEEDKQYWIDNVMLSTGMHAWQKTATPNELEAVVVKRSATKLGLTVQEYLIRFNNLKDKQEYYSKVWYLTERTYRNYKSEIDPNNLRSPAYHLDHKYSVIQGYYNRVDPELIASKFNLEILPRSDNSKKNSKCSLSITTLKEMYYGKVLPR